MGGAGPIPIGEIYNYFHFMEIRDPDDQADYLHHLARLDAIYLDHFNKKD